MAAGNCMKLRKKQMAKPALAKKCWTDDDFRPYLFGDYDICDQPPEVQIMLDLAEALADARTEWALKHCREEQREHGSPQTDSYRDPRFIVSEYTVRRGYEVRRE